MGGCNLYQKPCQHNIEETMDETEIEEIAKKIRDAFYGWPSNPAAVGLVYGPWETIPEHKRDMWRALAREATGGLTHDNPQSKAQAG